MENDIQELLYRINSESKQRFEVSALYREYIDVCELVERYSQNDVNIYVNARKKAYEYIANKYHSFLEGK